MDSGDDQAEVTWCDVMDVKIFNFSEVMFRLVVLALSCHVEYILWIKTSKSMDYQQTNESNPLDLWIPPMPDVIEDRESTNVIYE